MERCIITEIVTQGRTSDASIHIAHVVGKPIEPEPRSLRFKNIETGEEYLWLAGGFSWPGRKPGYAVVVAVKQRDDGDPVLVGLEEVEESDVPLLAYKAFSLFHKYAGKSRHFPMPWYGDAESKLHTSFLPALNEHMEELGYRQHFFLAGDADEKEPGFFETCSHLIREKLQDHTLDIEACRMARDDLRSIKTPAEERPEDHPAAMALGRIVKGLAIKPWTYIPSLPTTPEEEEERLFYENLGLLDQDRGDPYNRLLYGSGTGGGLRSTVEIDDDEDAVIYPDRYR